MQNCKLFKSLRQLSLRYLTGLFFQQVPEKYNATLGKLLLVGVSGEFEIYKQV